MEPRNAQRQSIGKVILEKIRSGELSIRPRWHFALKSALFAAAAVVLLLFILYIFSFILFALRESGVWFVPTFGFQGVLLFLVSLPWMLLALALILVILLEILVRRFSFAYREPFLYSLGAIILLVSAGSAFMIREELHDRVRHLTENRHLPLIEPLYRGYATPRLRNVHSLVVGTTTETGFLATERGGGDLEIIIGPNTRSPAGFNLAPGDIAVVVGERVAADDGHKIDFIEALGVMPTKQAPQRRIRPLSPFMRLR